MKKVLQNITIALVSLFITLAICEVGARFLLPAPMAVKVTQTKLLPSSKPQKDVVGADGSINNVIDWSGKMGVRLYPNVTGYIHNHILSHQDVVIRVNSLGFRGEEIPPRQPGQFRILFMGDSITFGDYLEESLTIPALVQEKLRARGYTNVVIMNAGLPGINLAEEYAHYQEMYESADPDLVLLGMYLNDAQQAQKFYAKTLRFPFSTSRFLTWVAQKYQLVNTEYLFGKVKVPTAEKDWREKFAAGRKLHTGNMLTTRDGFDFEIYNAHNDFGLGWSPIAWQQLQKIATSFVGLVRQNNSKFATFMFPILMQVYCTPEALSTYPQDQFTKIYTDLKVPNFDLLPVLRSKAAGVPPKELFYDHCHYRAVGNQLVSDILVEWLIKDSIVPKP